MNAKNQVSPSKKKNIGGWKKKKKRKKENPETLITSWNIFENISLILYLRLIPIGGEKLLLLKWLNFLIKETNFNN